MTTVVWIQQPAMGLPEGEAQIAERRTPTEAAFPPLFNAWVDFLANERAPEDAGV